MFNVFDHNNEALPITSLSNFYVNSNFDEKLITDSELLGIGLGSNNHEIGIWNLNSFRENMNPEIYYVSTAEENPIFKIPFLKSCRKSESFSNFNNSFSERSYFDGFSKIFPHNDILSYLSDPLMQNQTSIKEKWLMNSKNCYSNISSYFSSKDMAKKIIFLPQQGNNGKNCDNVMITAGNDRNIRYLNFTTDLKYDNHYKKPMKGFHINNVDNKERGYTIERNGDIYICHEFEKKNEKKINGINDGQNNFKIDEKAGHKDFIQDMIFCDREKGALLITASRDHTVKIWK